MQELIFKILLLAEPGGIGKTCFSTRYTENKFYSDKHIFTIGIDFKTKIINLENDKSVKLGIWELPSQARFRSSLMKKIFKNSHGIILLYDITDLESFKELNNNSWIDDIKENASKKTVVYLVGNKIDKEEEREVKKEDGEELAKELGFHFAEASALTGYNVKEIFEDLAEKIYNIYNMDKVIQKEIDKKVPQLKKYIDF